MKNSYSVLLASLILASFHLLFDKIVVMACWGKLYVQKKVPLESVIAVKPYQCFSFFRKLVRLQNCARRHGAARRWKERQQRRMIRSDSDTLMSLPGGGFIIRPASCHYDPMQKLIRLLSSGGISISARCIALPPSSAPSTTKQEFPWGILPTLIAACGWHTGRRQVDTDNACETERKNMPEPEYIVHSCRSFVTRGNRTLKDPSATLEDI